MARRFGDFGDAEDAVQEALLAASTQWPAEGTPENPVGWLISVASRRMTDRIRSDSARRGREELVAAAEVGSDPDAAAPVDEDDTLTLLLMCAHPALSTPSAIALTLRAVGGLTTGEIAAAFIVPEKTMAQRISRAKATIRSSGVAFAMPTPRELPERIRAAMHVVYLIFNEGYVSSAGADLARDDLAAEAIRIGRLLLAALPEEPEVEGLLALMLLTEARRPARAGANGQLIPLDEQDRSLWRSELIEEGTRLITAALARRAAGPYQLQAAIAAVHDRARRPQDTDWDEILSLYSLLERISPNPMVSLNRAIAAAMAHGPETGLRLLEPLESELGGHHRLHAARGHLLELAGDSSAAIAEYALAAERTTSVPEQRYLLAQAARLRDAAI